MTTLSPTQARVNLSSLLKRAAQGEEIGILHGDKVIALRPVNIHADDYAFREYGVTRKELDEFVRRTDARIKRERKAGRMKRYTGNLEADLAD
jgi:antitoxin (DNA-binding transcriptional repressor) of toxin-antitoxin stability system